MFSLYHNNKNETFSDAAVPTGIGSATKLMSGWGLKFFDYDNDGDFDLLLCNGHPDDKIDGRVDGVRYLEPTLLYRNTAEGRKNVSEQGGAMICRPIAVPGMVIADLDDDDEVHTLIAINDVITGPQQN